MQHIIAIHQIKERAAALNLSLPVLARRAGIHPSTAYRAAEHDDCRKSTAVKLTAELMREERRVAQHLADLDPALLVKPQPAEPAKREAA